MVELLAPVGGQEALIAAVESGANAVYLGGKLFGARASAQNFSGEELAEAVRFAHLRFVRVYVTVNTLVDNTELPELVKYLRYLYTIGVDAVIVQDMGVAAVAREVVPDMPLHASTQMTVHNLAGVQYLAKHGFKRVVLARELSIDDIAMICRQGGVEIEVFVHGALCVSYSGQCLMSSMIGGRSGNRGRCAQPCRLPYTLVDEAGNNALQKQDAGEYLLSPRDLNTLELLPQLVDAGVASFKIEGRMKRPEYVAVVVDSYRRAVDAFLQEGKYKPSDEAQKRLAQIFNRDFTTAYLLGKQGRKMMSDRRPNNRGVFAGRVVSYDPAKKQAMVHLEEPLAQGDIIEFWVKVGGRVNVTVNEMQVDGQSCETAAAGMNVTIPVPGLVRTSDRVFKVFDIKLTQYARSFFADSGVQRRVPLFVEVEVKEGQPLRIRMQDGDGFSGEAKTAFHAVQALKRPLDKQIIEKQISRLGNTIFQLQELSCRIEGELMVPVSEINDARRRAVEEVEKARLAVFQRVPLVQQSAGIIKELCTGKEKIQRARRTLLAVNAASVTSVEVALENGADIIYFGGETYEKRDITADEYAEACQLVRLQGKQIVFNTPRIVKEWQISRMKNELELFSSLRPDAVSIANVGVLQLAQQYPELTLHGDYPLNIYNSAAVRFFGQEGFASLTLSPELNFMQLEALASGARPALECLVHGYFPLMISEYCVLGSFLGGDDGQCARPCRNQQYWLLDRMKERFPIVTDQFCRMHVLNAKELSMLPHVSRFAQIGIDRIRIEAHWMSGKDLAFVTHLYRDLLDCGDKELSGVESRISRAEQAGITRGHYFRGVL
ncbi:MAG: peptidase [Firmicutes bacterium]|nr:peptidase [Bacillota bacterium]